VNSVGVHLISVLLSLMSGIVVAGVGSAMVVIMTQKGNAREGFRVKMDIINQEMATLCLKDELQDKIKRYYNYLWLNNLGVAFGGGVGIYNDEDLSRQLKHEVSVELVQSIVPLRSVKLLSYLSDDVLAAVFLKMKTNVFMPGDVALNEADPAREMFYISKGKFQVRFMNATMLFVV
jgi:hypothetical protein